MTRSNRRADRPDTSIGIRWNTPGLASGNTEWWRYRHDEWNTGRYGVDTRPPGALRGPTLTTATRTLAFTAPGDDWYAGQVTKYLLTHDSGVIEIPAMSAVTAVTIRAAT